MTDVRPLSVKPGPSLLFILLMLMAGLVMATNAVEPLNRVRLDKASDWDYRLDGQGQLWLAYYDEHRVLRLREPAGGEVALIEENKDAAPAGLSMAAGPEGVALLWRDKLPRKGLYLARIAGDEKFQRDIGDDTDPLARFHALEQGEKLHILWYGEKGDEATGQRYHQYYRQMDTVSGDFTPIERLMPGYYPVWVADASGNLLVFSWFKTEAGHQIQAQRRVAGAESFETPVKVTDSPPSRPSSALFGVAGAGSSSGRDNMARDSTIFFSRGPIPKIWERPGLASRWSRFGTMRSPAWISWPMTRVTCCWR